MNNPEVTSPSPEQNTKRTPLKIELNLALEAEYDRHEAVREALVAEFSRLAVDTRNILFSGFDAEASDPSEVVSFFASNIDGIDCDDEIKTDVADDPVDYALEAWEAFGAPALAMYDHRKLEMIEPSRYQAISVDDDPLVGVVFLEAMPRR